MENAQEVESVDQKPSLSDDILSAIDDAESAAAPAEETTEEVENTEEVEASSETEETEEAETAEPAAELVDESEEETPLLAPHEHWKDDYKSAFSEMTRVQQDAWLAREKDFEQGINQKGSELKEIRGSLEEVQHAVAPFVQGWQKRGITPYAGLQRALALAGELDTNPQEALVNLARERGVNLETALQEAPYVDPQLATVQRELKELQEQRDNAQQSQVQNEQQQVVDTLRAFESAADADGVKVHPHFQKVFEPMAILLKTGKAEGLEQAYEIACRYDPDIQEELRGQSKTTQIKQKQKAADKAKGASKSVDSSNSGQRDPSELSLDESILQTLEAAGYE